MKVKRTAGIDLDKTFAVDCEITKSWEREDGTRVIRGVASGIAEDRDGERVSKAAIADMARQAVAGMKLTSGHEQDWATEIGDIGKVEHDVEHDELLVEAELPPTGEDPLADKAWNRMTKYGEKLGFSVGGKLKKAYFELSPVGKKRKVLDGIILRHFALTKKPSYAPSFAEAVAKTADLDKLEDALEPGDYTLEHDVERPESLTVTKTDPSAASQDQGGANRNAGDGGDGEKPSKDVNGDQDDDDQDDDTPADKAVGRHLACPNCGHEFAADLPAEQDAPADAGGEDTTDRDAAKTAPEGSTMDLNKTVETLRALVTGTPPEGEPVEKKTTDDDTGLTDVEKMVAASHEENAGGIARVEKSIEELTENIGKSFGLIVDHLQKQGGQPAGRQSVARRGPEQGATPPDQVRKTATGEEPEEESVEEVVAKTESPLDALKAINKNVYGIQ